MKSSEPGKERGGVSADSGPRCVQLAQIPRGSLPPRLLHALAVERVEETRRVVAESWRETALHRTYYRLVWSERGQCFRPFPGSLWLSRFCQNSGLSRHGGKLTQKLGAG